MKFLIFRKLESGYGEKIGSYEAEEKDDSSATRSYLMSEPLASHFELPIGMDEDCIDLVEVDGVYQIQENEEKVMAKRKSKAEMNLNSIRMLREPLLKSADHEIYKLEDDSLDSSDMREYRKSLRSCTDPLKESDGSAKLSCENIDPSEFVFPVKP